jgi:hypothetical protein
MAAGEEPGDAKEVDEPAEKATAGRVVGMAVVAGAVGDGDLDNLQTGGAGERTEKAVKATEVEEVREVGAMEDFEGAAGVGEAITQDGISDGVGEPSAEASPGVIRPVSADATDQTSGASLGQEEKDIARVVLPVAIEQGAEVATGGLKAGPKGGALSEVGGVLEEGDAGDGADFVGRVIGAAVINGEDFGLGEESAGVAEEGGGIARFVMKWDDDREGGMGGGVRLHGGCVWRPEQTEYRRGGDN